MNFSNFFSFFLVRGSSFLSFLDKGLFPSRCVLCGAEGKSLCHEHELIVDNFEVYRASNLEWVQAASFYKNVELKILIERFKFQNYKDLKTPFGDLLNKKIKSLDLPSGTVVVPIPLHWSRKLFRGFNQSEKLADQLLGFEKNTNQLFRSQKTQQQALLKREDRLKNMDLAFGWKGESRAPEYVLLVDDVMTSGATLSQAAKVLKQNGSKKVYGLVLAHG